ncbi:hypothetical protein IEE94_08450 [Yimella sp. cx-573]|nr:hypothetical protein [Yimella sp. cx-573]
MDPLPQLRPLPGMTDAPTVTAAGGQITLAVPGKDPVVVRPAGRPAIAKYTTSIPVPRRHRVTPRKVRRVGWRLMDPSGRCLAWLANSDRPAYDDADVARFAAAAGIDRVDLGEVPYAEVVRDRGEAVGPGTSAVGAYVAPPFQWFLTGAVGGGMAFFGGPFIGDRRQSTMLIAVGVTFVGMFLGIWVSQMMGIAQHVWRERRYRQAHPTSGLRSAERTPGIIVTADASRVYVYDYFRTWEGPRAATTFRPYELEAGQRKHPRGLFVTWEGTRDRVDIVTRFEPAEVNAFAAQHGITVRPGHEGQLPKQHKVDETARVWFVEELGRVPWLGPLFWAIALVAVVVAVLGFIGALAIPTGISVCLIGLALLVGSGYGLGLEQLNDSLVHPERVG